MKIRLRLIPASRLTVLTGITPACLLTPVTSSHYRKSLLQNVEVGCTMFRSTRCSEYWTLSGQQPLDSTNCGTIPQNGMSSFLRLCRPDQLLTSTVPKQWKQARIRPVPKTPTPQQVVDYRPISITPVLTRVTERIVVRRYIYPALSSPHPALHFDDQYAFRPTGSTTAAIISLLNTVISFFVH